MCQWAISHEADTQPEIAGHKLPAHLDDGGDELEQEARHLKQAGVEVVKVVHDQALDVRPVMILIGHDHQVPIAQLLDALVRLQKAVGY